MTPLAEASYSLAEVCYTHTDVSGVSQSVTLLGGERLMDEGKVGYSSYDCLTTPVSGRPMSTSPDSVLLSPFNCFTG